MPADLSPRRVWREFERLLIDGISIKALGESKDDPRSLIDDGYRTVGKVELFDTTIYLTSLRYDENLRFMVGYVRLPRRQGRVLHPRIFYKDVSLVWRSASHFIWSDDEQWIGKGDLRTDVTDGEEWEVTAEETTNLPLEIQVALDRISRRSAARRGDDAVERVLRRAPSHRMEPYPDFSQPRARAQADPERRVNGNRDIATFEAPGDPTSLRFEPGFEPDFRRGAFEIYESDSRFYGGAVRKVRVLSANRAIQYHFFDGPTHTWIIPPQTLTSELTSYGVRTIDVHAHEDLFVPGFEYHYLDDTVEPPEFVSQIPDGFAGAAHADDEARADASRWLNALPVIRAFRRAFPR